MMILKMKEGFCTQILGASRQIFLSGRNSEIYREKGTHKQMEFILELLQAELTLRDENHRERLTKRAGFPIYKTFEGYSYHCKSFLLYLVELVLKRAEAWKNGTLERLLRDLHSLDLLILNEWGAVPVDKDGSQLLFHVISDSYESKGLILTTNLEFSKWGGIFTDDQMAAARIERLVHYGHLLFFEEKSYRMEHALMHREA